MIRKASINDFDKIEQFLCIKDYCLFGLTDNAHDLQKCCFENCYLFIDKRKLKGIIAVDKNDYLYLCASKQNDKVKNIENKLLRYLLRKRNCLHVNVEADNKKAVDFFHINDFKIVQELRLNSQIIMSWALGCPKGRFIRVKGDS